MRHKIFVKTFYNNICSYFLVSDFNISLTNLPYLISLLAFLDDKLKIFNFQYVLLL